MSDESPLPPLEPEVQAFLWQHAETGEPDTRALDRVNARLAAHETTKVGQLSTVPAAPPRRRFLAPEAIAVAAVLVASVMGGLVAFEMRGGFTTSNRPTPSAPASPQPPAPAEGVEVPLEPPLAEDATRALPNDPRDLYELGRRVVKEGQYTQAIVIFRRCLELDPGSADCTVMLGSTYAKRGASEHSASDDARSKHFYEQFLAIAPADDKRRKPVRSFLDERPSPPAVPPLAEREADQLLDAARAIEPSSLEHSRLWYQRVIDLAPSSRAAQRARERLGQLERATGRPTGRLGKIISNPIGAEIFVDGMRTGRKTPVLPSTPLELPVGVHTITFELNGRRSEPIEVVVTEGRSDTVIRGKIP
jgi:hypothetical protein